MLRDKDHMDLHPEFDEPWTALLFTFNMMFGEFDINYFKTAPASPMVAILLFVAFMVIIPTIMLNALIAIMVRTNHKHHSQTQHSVALTAGLTN